MSDETFEYPELIEEFLSEHNVLNISTSDEDGPWASAAFFAHIGRKFFFMADPNSRHGVQILSTGRIAATIHEDYPSWEEIKGMQLSGSAWLVEDPIEQKKGMRAFFRKYDYAGEVRNADLPDELKMSINSVRLYCMEADVIYWLDAESESPNRVQVYP